MHRTAFASDYTGMAASGAEWVVANLPAIKLVGIDYTSIAVFEDISGPHVPLLSQVLPHAAWMLTVLASLLPTDWCTLYLSLGDASSSQPARAWQLVHDQMKAGPSKQLHRSVHPLRSCHASIQAGGLTVSGQLVNALR